jgi:hypothetical protein
VVAYLAEASGDISDVTMRGHVVGPLAAHARTLPLRTPLKAGGVSSGALVSTAIVNETCFWEPGAPHWYKVHVSLCRGDEVIDEVNRTVGVRPLAVTADGLRLNGRAHELRAVSSAKMSRQLREACLAEKLALAVDEVTDADLAAASESGLPLIVPVGGTADQVIAELGRLSRWPAVMLAIVDTTEKRPESLRLQCPNMLLAVAAIEGRPIADWAHLAIVDDGDEIDVSRLPVPVITRLSKQAGGTLAERIATVEGANHGQTVGCIV